MNQKYLEKLPAPLHRAGARAVLARSTGGTVAAAVWASPPAAALQSPLLTAAMGQRSWSCHCRWLPFS